MCINFYGGLSGRYCWPRRLVRAEFLRKPRYDIGKPFVIVSRKDFVKDGVNTVVARQTDSFCFVVVANPETVDREVPEMPFARSCVPLPRIQGMQKVSVREPEPREQNSTC